MSWDSAMSSERTPALLPDAFPAQTLSISQGSSSDSKFSDPTDFGPQWQSAIHLLSHWFTGAANSLAQQTCAGAQRSGLRV